MTMSVRCLLMVQIKVISPYFRQVKYSIFGCLLCTFSKSCLVHIPVYLSEPFPTFLHLDFCVHFLGQLGVGDYSFRISEELLSKNLLWHRFGWTQYIIMAITDQFFLDKWFMIDIKFDPDLWYFMACIQY